MRRGPGFAAPRDASRTRAPSLRHKGGFPKSLMNKFITLATAGLLLLSVQGARAQQEVKPPPIPPLLEEHRPLAHPGTQEKAAPKPTTKHKARPKAKARTKAKTGKKAYRRSHKRATKKRVVKKESRAKAPRIARKKHRKNHQKKRPEVRTKHRGS
jgi:hypothetical protein